jgi:restriction system protein
MTNASFTPSARDLAAAAGIRLLSHHDIPDLYEKLFPEDGAQPMGPR